MPAAQSEPIITALKDAASVLREAGIPFALGGGLAAWTRGGPPTEHDVDLVIRPSDRETALGALVTAGWTAEYPPEGWLVKAHRDDVLIDLIHEPMGVPVDDAFFDRCEERSVAAVPMLVEPMDDVLVSKLLSLNEHHLEYAAPLEWARALREQIDWPSVACRTRESPFARTFLYLLRELGILTGTEWGS